MKFSNETNIIVALKTCKTAQKYIRHFSIKDFEEIPPLKKTPLKCVLELKSFKNNKLDGQNSLSLKFPNSKEDEANSLRDLFLDLNEKPFTKVKFYHCFSKSVLTTFSNVQMVDWYKLPTQGPRLSSVPEGGEEREQSSCLPEMWLLPSIYSWQVPSLHLLQNLQGLFPREMFSN